MSINNIRQRKLFKSHHQKPAPHRLGTQSSNFDDQPQQPQHLKTQSSDIRDSYSSRPTLQLNNLSRQVSALENKINKQEAMIQMCFEEMECLDKEYQQLRKKQEETYAKKIGQLKDRINRQQERNSRIKDKNINMVLKIIERIVCEDHQQNNRDNPLLNNKAHYQDEYPYRRQPRQSATHSKQGSQPSQAQRLQKAAQLYELVRFQLMKRQIKKMSYSSQQFPHQTLNKSETQMLIMNDGLDGHRTDQECFGKVRYVDQSFVIFKQEEVVNGRRQSQSILLDD